ncbi:hypothetical protein QJ850_gp376 [Acanthamoeba polyphaga mimivirus]|uniref:Uncharacterized protein n=1 Tax=Acanthamoeba polyphaga mimivirus Kroon TaxID=3069720 RepID=A0A0G2Y3G1_9VIRU|nr:hypothetical protein QJ850_gp376 [Acanthamoeba polyphaga mimivirus]AKI80323.1 hypothetical protein [Acanthamoeba polyphaga mimivirus Kroon]
MNITNINTTRIPAGTRLYLTKKKYNKFYIQPDKTLVNDNLFVAYDVKIGGVIAIPQGTRVLGNWVAESSPSIAVQLQLTKIFLYGSGQNISADSDLVETLVDYNSDEIDCAPYLYKIHHFKSPAGIYRRIVNTKCRSKILTDNNRNSIYLEVNTKEISVVLNEDIIPMPDLSKMPVPQSPSVPTMPSVNNDQPIHKPNKITRNYKPNHQHNYKPNYKPNYQPNYSPNCSNNHSNDYFSDYPTEHSGDSSSYSNYEDDDF